MPSRKQRRRRQKDRRHEYEYVYVDDEGREVEVEGEDEPAPAPRSSARGKAAPTKARGRAGRAVEPPSWRRVGRRALLLGPVLVLLMFLLKPKDASSASVVVQAVLFLLIFLPFSFLMDRMLYRSYLKRTGKAPQPKPKT